jgi:hypothetical protein
MARSRNIKPGFFKNEDLAECTLAARLCFAGLWTLADREGRLEDRPKRIKGELFPFDSIEVDPLLVELERWKFIRRYLVRGDRFIQIVNFVKHQVPHGTEKDGTIPDENGFLTVHERGKNGYATGNTRLDDGSATVKQASSTQPDNGALTVKEGMSEGGRNPLIPDSGFLIPDSLIPVVGQSPSAVAEPTTSRKRKLPEDFEPNEKGVTAARNAGLDLTQELQVFRDHHQAQGSVMADWQAAWRTWVAKAVQFGRGGQKTISPSKPAWATAAGFDTFYEANNAGCYEHNAAQFRNGQRIEAAR